MANTATRAEKKDSPTITFKNKEHEKFYKEYLPQCRYQDVYHKALVYSFGIDKFCCGYARYFWEAIKIRYPEYCFYVDWDMYAEN